MHWLLSLPLWFKPVLAALVIGLLGKVSTVFIRHLYAQILVDLDKARLKAWADSGSFKPPSMVKIPDAKVFKYVRWPAWLIKRATNYESRRDKLKRL
jgi:hypothetical protein